MSPRTEDTELDIGRRRVCMLTHSYYESDNRVQRYARSLARRGDRVVVLALRRHPEMPLIESLDGVTLHRIQDRFNKRVASPVKHLGALVTFVRRAARALTQWSRTASGAEWPWQLIHVHNVPDFLVYAASPSRRHGAKVILDIHDLMPEFFADKFKTSPHAWSVRSLAILERQAAQQADHIIVANDLWLERYATRCRAEDRCSAMINHVDERVFVRRAFKPASTDHPLIVFPGGFEKHQGLDVALSAFAMLRQHHPGARFHLYGDGSMKAQLQTMAQQLQLGTSVQWFEPLPLEEVARVMSEADLSVVPKLTEGFGNEAFSTKILEFMALGVPVVASRTRVDAHYFHRGGVQFFTPGDALSMEQAMSTVLRRPDLQEQLVREGWACVDRLGWLAHEVRYLDLVDRLTSVPRLPRLHTALAPPRTTFGDLESRP